MHKRRLSPHSSSCDVSMSMALSAIRQQRRGTTIPRKSAIIKNINQALRLSNAEYRDSSDYDIKATLPWLAKVQRKAAFNIRRGRILHEISVPEALHGVCSIKHSLDGQVIAASYGTGVIQVGVK